MRYFLPLALLFAACGGEPSPVVIGQLDMGTLQSALRVADDDDRRAEGRRRGLELTVNGRPTRVEVDARGQFTLDNLSTGELVLTVENDGISGTLTVDALASGELVEISISLGDGRLEIRVLRRTRPAGGTAELPADRGPVEIKGDDVVYYLHPGTYGDIEISGHRVTLVGAGCQEGSQTIVAGRLEVKGHDVVLVNLDLRGGLDAKGHRLRVIGQCR